MGLFRSPRTPRAVRLAARRRARTLAEAARELESGLSMSTLSERLDASRSLRAQIETSILPLAAFVDGRRFRFRLGPYGLTVPTARHYEPGRTCS
jgi:hypothetical protein